MKKLMPIISVCLIIIGTFSCKNKQTKEVDEQDYKKRLKVAEQKVDKIMEMMDLPEYGLVKLAQKDLFLSKDFRQAAENMMQHGRNLKDVDYPEKKFLELTQNMLQAFKSFDAALKANNKASIKKEWQAVHLTCKKCHDIYK